MPESVLRVALAQMDVIAGKPSRNFDAMSNLVAQAVSRGADLIVFPEMCVGGYYLSDKWNDRPFVEYLQSFNERVLALSGDIGIVFGNVGSEYPSPSSDCGRESGHLYNMALFAHHGEWVQRDDPHAPAGRFIQRDRGMDRLEDGLPFIPTQKDLSDASRETPESRWRAPFLFERNGAVYRIGLDVGCSRPDGQDYALASYRASRCDLMVTISSRPWVRHDRRTPDSTMLESPAADSRSPIRVYVNAVGMQNTGKSVFALDGGSRVLDADGNCLCACADDFEEHLALADIRLDGATEPGAHHFASTYESRIQKELDAIVTALRRFDQQVFPFAPKWVIGLSGGIDSSVTAAILALALEDTGRIVGYNLATRYNSDITKANAFNLAQSLGIRLVNGSIESLVGATSSVLEMYGYPRGALSGLALENAQARIRGHMLSTFASVEGGVIMNNGNKVEVALGYATLYGDAIGAICPIGDITKVELFSLARAINERFGREVVPQNLIPEETPDGYVWETMPSAELKDAQRDPMKWFYHDWLIERILEGGNHGAESVMKEYLENRLMDSKVSKWIRFYYLDDPSIFIDDLEWVLGQLRGSAFKRIQSPPTITVSRPSFGLDYHESQISFEETPLYSRLRQEILASR